MLNTKYQQIKISEYRGLYDVLIKEDHLLRKIKENVDFSFINPMLEDSYCKYYGRPATEPEVMFKLMFLKKLYDLSDEKVIENAYHDMSYKYFLNLDPEDGVVDASLLTKFRKTRIKNDDILNEMIRETVSQAIEKGIIKSNTIIVDATHTKSKSNPETPTQILRRISKELRKTIYKKNFSLSDDFPEKPVETATLEEEIEYSRKLAEAIEKRVEEVKDKDIEKRFNMLKDILKKEDLKEIQSIVDKDAKNGYKSEENSFFGYKNHLAMTEERIITAIEVSSGEAPDGKFLKTLVEKSKKNGINVEEVLGDMAYSGKDNLEYMQSKEIRAITKLNPIISNTQKNKEDGFEYIKDADCMRCPAGHLSVKKEKRNYNYDKKRNPSIDYKFNVEKCRVCPQQKGCYKPGAKSKSYCVRMLEGQHKAQLEFQESEYFKERVKQRYKIEAKNGELKQWHGLDKCKYKGLFGMQKQVYFSAFVTNVKRIVKLLDKKRA
jgi:IS5 family transposase